MGGAWLYRDFVSIMGKIMYILSIILIDNFPHHIPLHRSLWCILITATQPYTANWQSKVKHTCSSQKTLTNGDYHSSTLGNIRHVYVQTLHCIAWRYIALRGIAWHIWHDMTFHDMTWHTYMAWVYTICGLESLFVRIAIYTPCENKDNSPLTSPRICL